jgi:hypothetical protein
MDAMMLARRIGVGADEQWLAALVAGAEGNPLYLIELLRGNASADEGGAPGYEPTESLPPTMRSAVAQHLRLLSRATRHVVSVASVLGRQFSVTELALLTGKTASDLLPAVQEALRLEVLGERNEALFFRHDPPSSPVADSAALSTPPSKLATLDAWNLGAKVGRTLAA